MEKTLTIEVEELYRRLKAHWGNYKRGIELASKEKEGSPMYIAHHEQSIKAKGFKEAYEEMLFPVTGLIVNIDDATGEIIRPERKD